MQLLVFGMGYSATHFARALRRAVPDAKITAVRSKADAEALALDDPAVERAIAGASHILCSVPPAGEAGEDPVLARYGAALAGASARWIGYLSSTGVYGDKDGAWVDESAGLNGRRAGRLASDLAWGALHPAARVFRLPGIYGPGRSALDRLRAGPVARIDKPGHVISRIHVDDIAGALIASLGAGAPGIYNIADDQPAPGEAVTAHAARLLGQAPPPLQPLASARLSEMGRQFYAECRRVANGKMKRELRYRLRYPEYASGLAACLEEMRA